MAEFIMALKNGRHIPKEDKIFGVSRLAREAVENVGAENVINATIGSLLDDNGQLVVLSSVVNVLRNLEPEEYADYAPIGGVAAFLEKVPSAAFGRHWPEGYLEAVATPGGTGAIRNTICNYSAPGDTVLTSDWFWSPYRTICDENGRRLDTYTLFDAENRFNLAAFEAKIKELLDKQDHLVILFNAPSHNPTGFTPTDEEYDAIIDVLKTAAQDPQKKIIFFVDIAYIDFSGKSAEESRRFIPKFGNMPSNVLTIFGYSMSKGFTLYGMRSGAMLCVTKSREVADEYKKVLMHSNRGTWSNGTRPAMVTLVKVFNDYALQKKVNEERAAASYMLVKRGRAFMKEADRIGLKTCPYSGGFFLTLPCDNTQAICEELYKDNVFAVDIDKGIRLAISAVSEKNCARLPAMVMAAAARVQ